MRLTDSMGSGPNTPPARPRRLSVSGIPTGRLESRSRLAGWLGGRRGILLGALALLIGGGALGWPWLVAIGVAPVLLSVAPCAAMCALGLCMMRKNAPPPMPGVDADTVSSTKDASS